KSIPAVSTTNVIPAAITALIEVCLNTLSKLLLVKNLGLIILIIIEKIINPIRGLLLSNISFLLVSNIIRASFHYQFHDFFLGCFFPRKSPLYFTIMHH